jgi:hypothetical protein
MLEYIQKLRPYTLPEHSQIPEAWDVVFPKPSANMIKFFIPGEPEHLGFLD